MSELYPGSFQYPAMLINKQPNTEELEQMFDSGKYLISRKIDGCWYQLEKIDADTVYLFSRTVSKKTGELTEKIKCVPHIEEWAKKTLPDETIVIGEIYAKNGKSNNVTSIMGALPCKAVERQFSTDEFGGPLHFYIHDIIRYWGEDITQVPLKRRLSYLHPFLLGKEDYIEIAKYYCTQNTCSLFPYVDPHQYLEDIFADGGEGIVLKYMDGLYQPGKRPTYNKKVKTEVSFDVIITGFVDPEREYKGKELDNWSYWVKNQPVTKAYYYAWKAGFTIGAYDKEDNIVEIGSISAGMTDELRELFATNPQNYLGKVVEIQAMSVDKKEQTVRHGRLVRFRDDKSQKECTLEQIF